MLILVTGATGMVGGSVMKALTSLGHDAVSVSSDACGRPWRLGAKVDERLAEQAAGLVHLAWDADPASAGVNVAGSAILFDQMDHARVERVVFVSSQSAGVSRPTRYGRGKLSVESLLRGGKGLSVRPGLVWSDPPAGTFALIIQARLLGITATVRTKPVLHPVHLDDLGSILARAVVSSIPTGMIEVGSPHPISMQMLSEIALGVSPSFVLPSLSLRSGARVLSLAGESGRVMADRLLGLAVLEPMRDPQDWVLGVKCRPLERLVATRGA